MVSFEDGQSRKSIPVPEGLGSVIVDEGLPSEDVAVGLKEDVNFDVAALLDDVACLDMGCALLVGVDPLAVVEEENENEDTATLFLF